MEKTIIEKIQERIGYLEARNKKNELNYNKVLNRMSQIESRVNEIVFKKSPTNPPLIKSKVNLGTIVDLREDLDGIKKSIRKINEDFDSVKNPNKTGGKVKKFPDQQGLGLLIRRMNSLEYEFRKIQQYIPVIRSEIKPCINQTCEAPSTHAYFKQNLTHVKYSYCDKHGTQERMFDPKNWVHVRLSK